MNWKDWMKTYYPVSATVVNERADTDDLVLLEHARRKWSGLDSKTLDEHKLFVFAPNNTLIHVEDDEHLELIRINAESCSLCLRHFRFSRMESCTTCPIAIARDGVPCDKAWNTAGEELSPYEVWCRNHDATPMLKAIENATKYVEELKGGING